MVVVVVVVAVVVADMLLEMVFSSICGRTTGVSFLLNCFAAEAFGAPVVVEP